MPTKIWNKTYIVIFLINILISTAHFMMNTLVSKFTFYLGADAAMAGIVSSMFSATALILRPFSGSVIDKFPKQKVLRISIAMITFAFILYGCSESIPLVMLSRMMHGAGMGITVMLCLVMAGDALPEDKLITGIGCFSLGQVIAQAVAPGIGIFLVQYLGYHNTFFVIAVIMGAVLALTFCLRKEKGEHFKHTGFSFNSFIVKDALPPSVLLFLMSIPFCVINAFLLPYAEELGVIGIGSFFTVQASVLLFSRPLVSKIGEKYGVNKVLLPAMIIFALSMYLLSVSRTWSMFMLTAGISAFGYGACYPLLQALAIKSAGADKRGAASSTVYMGVDCGYLIGAVMAGFIIDRSGYSSMFFFMIIPISISIVLSFIFKIKQDNE